MPSGNSAFVNLGAAVQSGDAVILNPTSGAVVDLRGMDMAVIVSTSTRTILLPDSKIGRRVDVISTSGTVTVQTAAAVAVDTVVSGANKRFQATSTTGWSGAGDGAASDVTIADAGSVISATTVEGALQELAIQLAPLTPVSTTYNNTDATGTLTAAAIVGGIINRTGETSAYTDTTATAAQIITALGGSAAIPTQGWYVIYRNTVAFTATITAGDSVTGADVKVPPNSIGLIYFQYDAADSITFTGLGAHPQCTLPVAQFNTTAAASPVTPAAGILTGANHVFYAVTTAGAFGITTRTAAELYGDIPNCHIGFKFLLTIISDGDNTVTVTGGSNVTIPGTPDTAATNTTKTFLCTFTSATAMTMQVVNMGSIDATA